MFTDIITAVPDWRRMSAALPLLPSRASEKVDYDNLKLFRNNQARFMDQLNTFKRMYFDAASESDLTAAKEVLRRESQKLSLLECRLELYTSVFEQITQVPFNEARLAADHTSHNDTKSIRAIVTFKQARMLVDAVSLKDIAENNKLIVDISRLSRWHNSDKCYLMLDVFRSGTMEVEETVLHAVRADQIFRSHLASRSCGTPYSAPARIYALTYEKKVSP